MDIHSIVSMHRYPQMLERFEPIKQELLDGSSGMWLLTAEHIKTVVGKEN